MNRANTAVLTGLAALVTRRAGLVTPTQVFVAAR